MELQEKYGADGEQVLDTSWCIRQKIIRITPKRTKIVTDKFGEHDKYETFYKYDSEAIKESKMAKKFNEIRDGVYAIEDFKSRRGLRVIKDEDLDTLSEHINTVTEILKRYGK